MKESGAAPRKDRKKGANAKKGRVVNLRWAVTILIWSFVLSMAFRFGADFALEDVNLPVAFLILFAIILLGIVFDILGVAATAADEKPFHGMATKRVPGAAQSIRLIRNADKVSSFCNDVIGDICGIISGSTSAIIIARIAFADGTLAVLFPLVITGLVAGLTIGGKALGKGLAINHANQIIGMVGRFLYLFRKR